MDAQLFEQLLFNIRQETNSSEKKLEILFTSRGFFSGHQASLILYAFSAPPDKLRAMQIMEPRLCRMTCSEARDVIGAVSIHNDKIKVLESIKRYLMDGQTVNGLEDILISYPFEPYKHQAAEVMQTIRGDVHDKLPAGAHQGYAALGGLYTQSRPLVPHLYGTLEEQERLRPGKGKIEIPVGAKPGVVPSIYTGHPSYALPQGRDYAEDRGYPVNAACSSNE